MQFPIIKGIRSTKLHFNNFLIFRLGVITILDNSIAELYSLGYFRIIYYEIYSSVDNKVDVIIHGIETIGSAERSCSPEEMKDKFHTISDGGYANILYTQFSKERVEKELNDFTSKKFFKRSGGGIGMTRIIRAMKLSNLIE